jgi:hypothetical protein
MCIIFMCIIYIYYDYFYIFIFFTFFLFLSRSIGFILLSCCADCVAANLLINNQGILKLADFGLARPIERRDAALKKEERRMLA